MAIDFQQYRPPGPVGASFMKSRGPIDIIMGPAGSGKTVASCVKGPMLAASYMPVCRDGWVRFKMVVVRDTYRDFARTALASWHELFPPDHPWTCAENGKSGYEGGQDRPIRHHLRWRVQRGRDDVVVDFILETGAIGDHNVEQYIKGYEVSAAWCNECDLLDPKVPGLLFQRTGRYPPLKEIAPAELDRVSRDGRATMRRIGLSVEDNDVVLPRVLWGDMNPPDVDHPLLIECVGNEDKPKNPAYNFFRQPGGLEPNAENRAGKPRASYELEARTQQEHIVRRMVHGMPGYAQDGKPVYPEFNDKLHVADGPIEALPGIPLSTGKDAGGSPAGVVGQFLPNGQLRILAELVTEPGTGPARYAQMFFEMILDRFPGFAFREAWGDPSAFHGADTQAGELAWMQTVAKALSINIMPTPTNEPHIRQEAVRWYLGAPIDQTTPRLVIDPRCKVLISGFAAHYKLTKQASISGTDKLDVVKNRYSHPHDALQYMCLGHRGLAMVMEEAAKLGRPENVTSLHARRVQRQAEQRRPGDFNVWDV